MNESYFHQETARLRLRPLTQEDALAWGTVVKVRLTLSALGDLGHILEKKLFLKYLRERDALFSIESS